VRVAVLDSVNLGSPAPNPYKETRSTGIDKRAQTDPVEVRPPGPKFTGLGSGLVGDFIGDGKHHGGDEQAVYAYAREDLDGWETRLDRPLPNGFFGENLTTRNLDVNGALLGERWRIGSEVELQVTTPRIPCSTFRGWVGERGWLKTFTALAQPGAYLSVVTPGMIRSGDTIEVVHRPDHDVTVALTYRAITTERDLLPRLLAAGDDLVAELREAAEKGQTFDLD
jgi:MOSC domain-containing protein YiiM